MGLRRYFAAAPKLHSRQMNQAALGHGQGNDAVQMKRFFSNDIAGAAAHDGIPLSAFGESREQLASGVGADSRSPAGISTR